ncbi:hypothetical protein TNCV_2504741 [Trichonephila clavipes]|uniref:Uncharacterized protein n=1 Tax=Trichonephila clavipes TaxID=2585209 RepID=A0A8X7BJK0_TRICX|nr:hypothetical protein TNCV_2504741 [Trichonephila clavipes]
MEKTHILCLCQDQIVGLTQKYCRSKSMHAAHTPLLISKSGMFLAGLEVYSVELVAPNDLATMPIEATVKLLRNVKKGNKIIN